MSLSDPRGACPIADGESDAIYVRSTVCPTSNSPQAFEQRKPADWHFARNLLANIPKGHQEMVAAASRTIFAQVSPEEISAQWDHVPNMLTERFDKAAALMLRAKEDVLAFGTFPRPHWRQIWSTNPLERLNKEIKRRSRVVGIFPNEEAAIRLCGAVVLDINDEWAASERRYFSEASMADLYPPRHDDEATPGELVPAE